MDRDKFRDRDLSVVDGCWRLESSYTLRGPGINAPVRNWRVCFNSGSNSGTQRLEAVNNARRGQVFTCSNSITRRFNGNVLELRDPADTRCSQGITLYKRVIRCTMTQDGRARCESVANTGARDSVTLRRAGGG